MDVYVHPMPHTTTTIITERHEQSTSESDKEKMEGA
jgi:hypothetical protein